MAQLCQHQEELDRLGADVLLISFGADREARAWLRETGAPFRLLEDPGRDVYKRYGLQRSWLGSWNLKTLWRYIQLMARGRRWRGIRGDSAQLGGDFIVDRQGTIQLTYRSKDPTDRPSVGDLLVALRRLGQVTGPAEG